MNVSKKGGKSDLGNLEGYDLAEDLFSVRFGGNYGIDVFHEFNEKLGSLLRFYFLSKGAASECLSEKQKELRRLLKTETEPDDWPAEIIWDPAVQIDAHEEETVSDAKYFDDFICAAVLTQLFSSCEWLVDKIVNEVTDQLKVEGSTPQRGPNFVLERLRWLSENANLQFTLDGESISGFRALWGVRNNFVHARVRINTNEALLEEIALDGKDNGLTKSESYIRWFFLWVSDVAEGLESAVASRFYA
jgi:hypothetical protein